MSLVSEIAAGVVLLDGGLATRLEARGHDLSDSLWSARLLLEQPQEVRAAHADFFAAGARMAITASYQLSEMGLRAAGRDVDALEPALRRSVTLARQAARETESDDPRPRFVAASVGPYGAALADGSEYRGDYGLTVAQLRAWHRPRLEILADAGADVLALETVPCLAEAEALVAEVDRLGVPAWLSMTPDGARTRLGEPLSEAFAIAASSRHVVAVGANCFDPGGAATVLTEAGRASPGLPRLLYPNSGETWDARARRWTGSPTIGAAAAAAWVAGGARLVGGCCRVSPELIAAMKKGLTEGRPSG